MPVNIIDTLKPKNGGSFPIVEAIDVFVENYGNLAEAVSHFATDVMIEAINTVLSGKANTSDVNSAVANLQGQIDQIVISASAEAVVAPEVTAARVGADSTSYNTLKARLDAENTAVKTSIASVKGIAEQAFDNSTVTQLSNPTFDYKHITANGQVVDNNNKNLTSSLVLALKGSSISVDIGYKYQYALYDKTTGNFISRQTWLTSDTISVLDSDYKIRVEISDVQESVLSDMSILTHLHADLYSYIEPATDFIKKVGEHHLEFIKDKVINLGGTTGVVIDTTAAETVSGYSYTVADVKAYDVLNITGTGGDNPRLWGFLDENNILISVSGVNTSANRLVLPVPSGAVKVVINSTTATVGDCYIYDIDKRVDTIAAEIEVLDKKIDEATEGFQDEPFTFINGKNLKLAYPIGTVIDLTSTEDVDFYSYTVADISAGDYIVINGGGGLNPRLWGFLDANNALLAVSPGTEAIATNLLLQAPAGAAKIVINVRTSTKGNCYLCGLNSTVDKLKEDISTLQSEVTELSKCELSEPNAVRQSNNIVNTLGINTFRQKTMEVAEPISYKAWPFVGVASGKLLCLYSIGTSHTDAHSSIYVKYSDNGVIWSADRGIISTDSQRDNVTGKGYDEDGNLIFWVRRGAPGASGTTFELWKATDYKTFEQVSAPTFATANGHIGDIVNVPEHGLFAVWNNYGSARSWGYVKSIDNGETWTEVICESSLAPVYVPVEMSPVYFGNGKILVMGRQDADGSAGTFQIQSDDYGETFTKYSTNINVAGATPSVIFDPQEDTVYQYYFERATGQLKLITATLEIIWNNPTLWPSAEIIAQVD